MGPILGCDADGDVKMAAAVALPPLPAIDPRIAKCIETVRQVNLQLETTDPNRWDGNTWKIITDAYGSQFTQLREIARTLQNEALRKVSQSVLNRLSVISKQIQSLQPLNARMPLFHIKVQGINTRFEQLVKQVNVLALESIARTGQLEYQKTNSKIGDPRPFHNLVDFEDAMIAASSLQELQELILKNLANYDPIWDSPFSEVLLKFCTLPALNNEQFAMLSLLIDFGMDPTNHALADMLELWRKQPSPNEDVVIQLIKFLLQKGLQLNDDDSEGPLCSLAENLNLTTGSSHFDDSPKLNPLPKKVIQFHLSSSFTTIWIDSHSCSG